MEFLFFFSDDFPLQLRDFFWFHMLIFTGVKVSSFPWKEELLAFFGLSDSIPKLRS